MGKPNDYHLSAALPRLPSYDSVRKQDRQRQVHTMISQRFGLGGSHEEVSEQHIASFPSWFFLLHSQQRRNFEAQCVTFYRDYLE